MNNKPTIHTALTWLIALVWLANGLFCKVLNLVPRHRQIVGTILGSSHAGLFTIAIGVAETCMALWILTGIKPRLNAICQAVIIAVMNILEFLLVPGLLLWGRLNIVFALIFIVIILYNQFVLNNINNPQA